MQRQPDFAQFTSKTSSAGDVYVGLGFVPSYARVIVDPAGTNSNVYEWYNPTDFPLLSAGMLLTTGSSGIRTLVTTAGQIIEAYAGGDIITGGSTPPTANVDETTNSDPKHVNPEGTAGVANDIAVAGILVPKEIQVAGAVCIVEAYRKGNV